MSAKLVPTFADRGCHVVSAVDIYGRNLRLSRPECDVEDIGIMKIKEDNFACNGETVL
jgi:hypothetical protein